MGAENKKCFGVGNVLRKPFGFGGQEITVYTDEEDIPQSVACPLAIRAPWGVYCAAKRPEAVNEAEEGKQGFLSGLPSCYQVEPRSKNN